MNPSEICASVRDVILSLETHDFYNKMKKGYDNGRTGEVVFAVIRPNGKIIAVTCDGYPEGVYRIPSGGTGKGEDPVSAVQREVKEELGLEIAAPELIEVLNIRFVCGRENFNFTSHIFIAAETGGRLMSDATDNEIGGVRELDAGNIAEFQEMVGKLGSVQGRWNDWGRFRQLSSGAVLRYFNDVVYKKQNWRKTFSIDI
ncbi:MAG: NUDIX domain-containing protein [Eubacteriales bacterium]|nr:NUDIX domain-containing protein [Eubacteriales bacterium]